MQNYLQQPPQYGNYRPVFYKALPITTTINGVAGVPIKNALGQPLLSNVVPYGRTYGRFVMGGATTTATDSYVILRTPCYA